METIVQEQQETNTRKSTSPKLTCVITGTIRATNEKYLQSKAEKKGISVDEFVQNYAGKQAVKRLRTGQSVEDVRRELNAEVTTPVSDQMVKDILRINGKSKK
jgi:flagellar basal body-associated protein FliL